jgi:hypothetical protein
MYCFVACGSPQCQGRISARADSVNRSTDKADTTAFARVDEQQAQGRDGERQK